MATLNKTPKAPVQGNNIAPNPTGLGGNYFNINGNAVSVETKVVCNRLVLVTTLPDDLDAGAYVALVSVTGELSRLSWLKNPDSFFWEHQVKKAVKLLLKFEKDDIPPVKIVVEKPQAAKPDVPPAPVEPEPTAPAAVEQKVETAESKTDTTVYEVKKPPVEATVEPKPATVAVEEVAVPVEPTQPEPTPVETQVQPEAVSVAVEEPAVEPEPETPVVSKQSSGKMSLKDIANEDATRKQKNKYKPGKNSRAQQLVESQRVMQQMKHART